MAAAHPAADQALLAQHRERSLSRALRYPVLLREGLHGRDSPLQFPGFDLGAQDRRQLLVQRLLGVMINSHMITIGTCTLTCAFRCPSMDPYGRRWTLHVT